jgi:signal transduction histidine kinase
MTLLSSLTNRIFLASAMLAIATTGVAVYLVGVRVTREAGVELQRGLSDAGSLVAQQQHTLINNYVLFARLLADLPKLKAAVATQDPNTARPLALDYRQQVGADLLLITGRNGVVLARVGEPGGDPPKATLERALAGQEALEFRAHPEGILQVITVPVAIGLDLPDVLGTLSLGVRLDGRLADQFKRATHSEVAFVLDGRVRAATLPRSTWPELTALAGGAGTGNLRAGDSEYVALALPLQPLSDQGPKVTTGTSAAAFVLQSRTERLRFLRTVNTALALAAFAAVLLATVLSYAVARTVTRPLGAITNTMREVATTGDLTRKITLRGPAAFQDEDARLLATTFNTLTDSIARFQREATSRERLLSLGRLSTVIAHEVRNPLMIIKAALRSLRPEAPHAEMREAVHDIDEEVVRLNRIVNDVLDFARPPVFSFESTDLGHLCLDAADAASRSGDGPAVITDVPTPGLMVTTDAERLRTALVNILANARQAVAARDSAGEGLAGPREPGPDVHLSLRTNRMGRVRLRVADRGIGIRPEDLSQIFDPYFTTRRTGTGLGLPIARNIIEGLGGTVAVQSNGSGTTIDIELPERPPSGIAAS